MSISEILCILWQQWARVVLHDYNEKSDISGYNQNIPTKIVLIVLNVFFQPKFKTSFRKMSKKVKFWLYLVNFSARFTFKNVLNVLATSEWEPGRE